MASTLSSPSTPAEPISRKATAGRFRSKQTVGKTPPATAPVHDDWLRQPQIRGHTRDFCLNTNSGLFGPGSLQGGRTQPGTAASQSRQLRSAAYSTAIPKRSLAMEWRQGNPVSRNPARLRQCRGGPGGPRAHTAEAGRFAEKRSRNRGDTLIHRRSSKRNACSLEGCSPWVFSRISLGSRFQSPRTSP
jgi:hypothetical protein